VDGDRHTDVVVGYRHTDGPVIRHIVAALTQPSDQR